MIGKSSRGQINLPRLGIGVAGSSSLVEASVKLEQALSGLEIRSTGIGVGVAIGSAGGYGDFLGTLSKLKELSRTLEKKLGLKIVSGDRAPDSKTRAADRNEFEEARRLGTDLGHIRNTISDCLHRSNREARRSRWRSRHMG